MQDVYVHVENDEPQFATVKEGLIGRRLNFVPLSGITVRPDDLQVTVTKEEVKSAPYIELQGDRTSGRGALAGRRIVALPPLCAQLHPA